jgi:hypothetical protein
MSIRCSLRQLVSRKPKSIVAARQRGIILAKLAQLISVRPGRIILADPVQAVYTSRQGQGQRPHPHFPEQRSDTSWSRVWSEFDDPLPKLALCASARLSDRPSESFDQFPAEIYQVSFTYVRPPRALIESLSIRRQDAVANLRRASLN